MLRIRHSASLARDNTLGLPAVADCLIDADTLEDYRQAIALVARRDQPLTVLGGGSNVVLGERIDGMVLRPRGQRRWLMPADASGRTATLHVEAGANWHQLVEETTRQGWWGLENLALIPGSTGAAPIQNIGAYGVEIAERLERVHCIELASGRYRVLERDACAFGYRDSIFKGVMAGRLLIVRLELRLTRHACPRLDYGELEGRLLTLTDGMAPTPSLVAEAVMALRREKLPDPALLGNAGSFFKNPVVTRTHADVLKAHYPDMPSYPVADHQVKLAAGWLIDQCGFRGYRDGSVGVHDRQALVLVHHGGGTTRQLLSLAGRIVRTVRERFDVTLEQEPGIIGVHQLLDP